MGVNYQKLQVGAYSAKEYMSSFSTEDIYSDNYANWAPFY